MNFILTMANACVFLCLNSFYFILLRMTESSVSSSFNWSDITSSLECYNIKSHVYCTLENDVWGSIFIHCKYVLFDRVSVTKIFFFPSSFGKTIWYQIFALKLYSHYCVHVLFLCFFRRNELWGGFECAGCLCFGSSAHDH